LNRSPIRFHFFEGKKEEKRIEREDTREKPKVRGGVFVRGGGIKVKRNQKENHMSVEAQQETSLCGHNVILFFIPSHHSPPFTTIHFPFNPQTLFGTFKRILSLLLLSQSKKKNNKK